MKIYLEIQPITGGHVIQTHMYLVEKSNLETKKWGHKSREEGKSFRIWNYWLPRFSVDNIS